MWKVRPEAAPRKMAASMRNAVADECGRKIDETDKPKIDEAHPWLCVSTSYGGSPEKHSPELER